MPLDLVLLTRERIQAVLDDAVGRGRMTRADATELATALFERGRRRPRTWSPTSSSCSAARATGLDDAPDDVSRPAQGAVTGSADRVMREVDRARRAAGIGTTFPISNYDDLTAAQVTGRLAELTPAELRKVRDYEQRNANRKSVLAAVDQKLG
jgi:polyhydroxyalkanoate synthesis regulator phasin